MGYGIGEAFLMETPLAEQAVATELFSERIGVGRSNRIQRLKDEVIPPSRSIVEVSFR